MQIKLAVVIRSVCKYINTGSLSFEWKKVNVVPKYKKVDKCFKNYRPVSLLPIYLKISEGLLKTS